MSDFEKERDEAAGIYECDTQNPERGYTENSYKFRDFRAGADWAHTRSLGEIGELKEKETDLSVKLQRTVDAAYHALLEMSAWMGIPEKKRHAQIEEFMSNVKFCAEHDCRHMDESQRNNELAALLRECVVRLIEIAPAWLPENIRSWRREFLRKIPEHLRGE